MSVADTMTDVDRTLAAVDARLRVTFEELTALWREVAGPTSDVLGGQDLPELLATAARGGKRMRPKMAHWGWVAAGAPPKRHHLVIALGAALELLHVFALVQDDVMDRSELRRGRLTVHEQARRAHLEHVRGGDPDHFGNSIGVLAGDLVHAEASLIVAELPPPVRQVWRRMVIELVAGQRKDLTGAALGRRDIDQARTVARLKSGSYTVARPLEMGALIGGASPELVASLTRYGEHTGEAFGLSDDILGMWGDSSVTGKSNRDDLAEGKPTVLLALASARLGEEARRLLERLGHERLPDADLERLRAEMDTCGIRAVVQDLVDTEIATALAALQAGSVDPRAVRGLSALAAAIARRQS